MKLKFSEKFMTHLVLVLGAAFMLFPVYIAFVGSTHDAATIGRGLLPLVPGPYLLNNYSRAWALGTGGRVISVPVRIMLTNSFITALIVAVGKIFVSSLTAYALVYFKLPLQNLFFWMILVTLMLP